MLSQSLKPSLSEVLSAEGSLNPEIIGYSREQRNILGYRFGNGDLTVSLIAGCHADEPTGSMFLTHLCNYLGSLKEGNPLKQLISWYIVPYANPDGAERNLPWYQGEATKFDLSKNLQYAVREQPGDDIEFGFPSDHIKPLRPENQAIFKFWQRSPRKFDLHVSLHGMRISYGPWFLIDKDFISEVTEVVVRCSKEVKKLGYQLHDVDRKGEKGFLRFGPGFGSRPNSRSMKKYFELRGEHDTANKFHLSSMESIRILGDPCLTLVTEMPLFIVPKQHQGLPWPDPTLQQWGEYFDRWSLELHQGAKNGDQVNQEAAAQGLISMSIRDQMHLQWEFIWSGIVHQFNQSIA